MIFQGLIDRFTKHKDLETAKSVIAEQNKIITIQQERIDKAITGVPLQYEVGAYKSAGDSRTLKAVDFKTLRAFSENYDILRAAINHKKRQIAKLSWDIRPKVGYEDKLTDEVYDKLTTFFENPGGRLCKFREFVDKILEDLIVLDAVAIWKKKDRKGNLIELVNVDATTIRIVLNTDGAIPLPPDFAYIQKVNEEVLAHFTIDEMAYDFMNHRTKSPYGLSPIESMILDIDASLKSQISNLNILGEGNVPEGFLQVPSDWKLQQLREFQEYFDALLAGNLRNQNRIKIIPSAGRGTSYIPTKKPEDMRFLEYEKWLAVKVCMSLEVQPQELGFTEDVNRSTGESQLEIAESRGLKPMAMFVKSVIDDILKYDFKNQFVEFVWTDLSRRDEQKDAEMAQKYIPLGVISVDEVRDRMGLDPIGLDHYIQTAGGIMFVKDLINGIPAEEEETKEEEEEMMSEEMVEELTKWRKKAVSSFKAGKVKDFKSKILPEELIGLVKGELLLAKSIDEVKAIFKKYLDKKRADLIFEKAVQLKKLVNLDSDERLHRQNT